VAFGGYPAVPPVLAARLLRNRPVILLHEQNAVLGRANAMLARAADCLFLNFPNTRGIPAGVATAVLGNPVRPAIAALAGQSYAAPGEKIELLCLGGSLGAKIFGSLIPGALALLPANLASRINLAQQCRADDLPAAKSALAAAGIAAELAPFFYNVAGLLTRAHLVIARAGASTVAELSVAGRPAILIPLPNAIDDHQRANADALVAAGGGWRLDQATLTPQILADKIEKLLNQPELLTIAAAASAKYGRPDAAERLADRVQDMMVAA
jgi:UDP-N-acetylglucosamine--N-acetylmuramyl-(pentapeptide) pyrophosphoryl-undecaprenol N-acetylglucosamine transferase